MQELEEQEEEDAALNLNLFDDAFLDAGVTSGGDPAAWNIPGLKEEDEEEDEDEVADDSAPADDGGATGSVTSGGDAASWGQSQGNANGSKKPD